MSWHEFVHNKTFVVTGAAGFIGSHVVDALLEVGAHVYGIDSFITGRRTNLSSAFEHTAFQFLEADVSAPVESYFQPASSIDGVFHLASPASPPHYQAHPIETYLVNSMGTHHWLQFLHQYYPTARFLFASTSEVYGDPLEHPQKESYWGNVNPNGARSCYDESKRMGETVCGVHRRNLGMDARIIRIFNTYGPRINPHDERVIPEFIRLALAGQPLSVFGEGQQTRSFCFISDLVDGILRTMSAVEVPDAINLGNPDEKTVLELAQLISGLVGVPEQIIHHPLPEDDPTRRKPDISLAQEVLQWSPQVSLQDGLQQTIEHFKKFE